MNDRVEDSGTVREVGPPLERKHGGLNVRSDLNALTWSIGAAVFTGLATALGLVFQSGRFHALGLYTLSYPRIDQGYLFKGTTILLGVLSVTVLPFIVGRLIFLGARWGAKRSSFRLPIHLPCWARERMWWIVLALLIAIGSGLNSGIAEMVNRSDAVILRNTTQIGRVWTGILLDQDDDESFAYSFLYGTGLAIIVWCSYWLLTAKLERSWSKLLFSLFVGVEVLSLLIAYAYLSGVASTVDRFPLVSFSGQTGWVDQGGLLLLLGSDDKQFAFLVVKTKAPQGDTQEFILYVPRSEVKWMAVLRLLPLQPVAKLSELGGSIPKDVLDK